MKPASRKVLLLSEYVPTRTRSGSRSRLAAVVEAMRARGYDIHLVLVQPRLAPVLLPEDARLLVQRVSRLPLASHPEFDPPIATHHLLALTRAKPGIFARARSALSKCWAGPSPALGLPEQIEHHLIVERPDIVYIDHTWLASLVLELIPRHDCLWVVDTHDCLHQRDASLKKAGIAAESGLSREEEAALLSPFDVVIAIQDEERRVFEAMLPGKKIITAPHCQALNPQPSTRPAIGFVGSDCDQNVRGLEAFLQVAWPEIARRCPTASLEIAGSVCNAGVIRRAARRDKRVRRLGHVDDLARLYHGPAVMVCPLWMGSGLKIKLVEALAFGKATVATAVAAQGCERGIDRAFRLVKEPHDFVAPVTELLQNASQRTTLEAAALEYARDHFAPKHAWKELDEALAQRGGHASNAESPQLRLVSSTPGFAQSPQPSDAPAAPTPDSEAMLIPRILHQTWKRREIPFEFLGFVDSWRRLHPDWEHRLWTDEDNRDFIATHYPDFLECFDAYPQPIQRADAVRYFLLHHFGGVYVDLDFRACRRIDPLLAGKACVLGLEPDIHSQTHGKRRIVGNAFMAAAPGHPLMAAVLRRLPEFHARPTLESTGPFMLTEVYDSFDRPETVALTPSALLYPLTLEQADRYRSTGHTDVDLSAAYAIHFHHGTWWRGSHAHAA